MSFDSEITTIHLVMDFMTVILQDEIMDLLQEIMVSVFNIIFVLYKYILCSVFLWFWLRVLCANFISLLIFFHYSFSFGDGPTVLSKIVVDVAPVLLYNAGLILGGPFPSIS